QESGRAPSPLFFAARATPSSPSSPPRKRGGRRADRRNLPLVHAPIGGRVAPVGAPSRRSHRGAGSALSALRLVLPSSRSLRRLAGPRSFRASSRPRRSAVSQLLAGGRSTPGRSPAPPGRGGAFISPRGRRASSRRHDAS